MPHCIQKRTGWFPPPCQFDIEPALWACRFDGQIESSPQIQEAKWKEEVAWRTYDQEPSGTNLVDWFSIVQNLDKNHSKKYN